MITIPEAAEALGVTKATIYLSKKYQPYIIKIDGVKMFDIEAYASRKSSDEYAIARATNLIMELKYDKNIPFAEISRRVGYPAQNIQELRITPWVARKILKEFS